MLFDINGGEWLILFVVAALVIGPKRIPVYAEQLGRWVRRGREFLRDAKARVDEELGEEAKDLDWAALDPRQYDPRRIVREALTDTPPPAVRQVTKPGAVPASSPSATGVRGGSVAAAAAVVGPTPFDDEAT